MASCDLEGDDADIPRPRRDIQTVVDVPDMQYEDLCCPRRDGAGQGNRVDDPAIDVVLTSDGDGRKQAGYGR